MKRVELSVENPIFCRKLWRLLQFQNFAFELEFESESESESESSLRFTAPGLRARFTGRYRLENCVPPVYSLFTGKNDPKMSVFCP